MLSYKRWAGLNLVFKFNKRPPPLHLWPGRRLACLLTQTEFFDQSTVFVNVLFRIVRKQALTLAYHSEQGAAGRVVFLEFAEVFRQALNAVGEQCYLYLSVASVVCRSAVLCDDLGDFFFVVIDCHF